MSIRRLIAARLEANSLGGIVLFKFGSEWTRIYYEVAQRVEHDSLVLVHLPLYQYLFVI